MRIALLEDDPALSQLYQNWLQADGHSCVRYGNGERFKTALGRESFDLAIIDWELPDTDGTTVLRYLREQLNLAMPVLFATNRNDEQDIVFALRAGADDYMVKPVKQQELLARVAALGRRSGASVSASDDVDTSPYIMDAATLTARYAGDTVTLTRKEFDLAIFLFRNKGRLLSRKHIMESVWGQSAELNTRTVDTHVSAIRQKMHIGPERGWRVVSIYGHGYRLEQLVEKA